jgi:hypothetical protein
MFRVVTTRRYKILLLKEQMYHSMLDFAQKRVDELKENNKAQPQTKEQHHA